MNDLQTNPHDRPDEMPWLMQNEMKTPDTRNQYVPHMISRQGRIRPAETAITAGDESITWAELEARSNRLSRYLLSAGVGAEVLVCICLPRSVSMVVSALAVLKAGGAYLPCDPAYPTERIGRILSDAKPALLITSSELAGSFACGSWHTVELGSVEPALESLPDSPIDCPVAPDQLAYVIYTSGSTGRPKGVEIVHSSLLNLVEWHHRAFDINSGDQCSQLASPGFDAAVWEIWPCLAAGGCLHIAAEDVRSDPEALRDWLISQGITIGFVPTPIAERMIRLDWPRHTPLRVMLTGADTLHSYPPGNLPFTLVNNYGPTECTVVATSGPVAAASAEIGRPSIGRPISNVQIHILDERLQPVPVGAPGEICVGGAGLARGYLNAPDLTAARFITTRLEGAGVSRLYRTGDLALALDDGQIAFLGRMDDQVKIRGHRVEPEEIVSVLCENPALAAACVIARETSPGDNHLIAYVVLAPGMAASEFDLRQFLGARLPEYMVPSVFIRLDALPLSDNGKVDRSALPEPSEMTRIGDETYVAPRTPLEEQIAGILAPMLGLSRVGVESNFFMLGGHSLFGTQLIGRIRDAFGVDLSLRKLFDSPTVAGVAEDVERLLYLRLEAMSEDDAEKYLQSMAQASGQGVE